MNADIRDLDESEFQICITPCSSAAENELRTGSAPASEHPGI